MPRHLLPQKLPTPMCSRSLSLALVVAVVASVSSFAAVDVTEQARVLTGKKALVTGAGTGLGKAMAAGLAEAGASVVLVGRRAALIAVAALAG